MCVIPVLKKLKNISKNKKHILFFKHNFGCAFLWLLNFRIKKISDFGGNLRLKSGIFIVIDRRFPSILEYHYRKDVFLRHVGSCSVMLSFARVV